MANVSEKLVALQTLKDLKDYEDGKIGNIIKVSSTQPTGSDTQAWVKPDSVGANIPTAEDIAELESDLDAANTQIAQMEAAIAELRAQVSKMEPSYSYGTEDLQAGVSELETGKLYFVYE